jgi:hypothetical protein
VSLDAARLKKTLEERVSDVAGILGRHTAQGRQMLRKIIADKIELEAVGSGRKRGYRFRGRSPSSGSSVGRPCKLACLWWPQGDSLDAATVIQLVGSVAA